MSCAVQRSTAPAEASRSRAITNSPFPYSPHYSHKIALDHSLFSRYSASSEIENGFQFRTINKLCKTSVSLYSERFWSWFRSFLAPRWSYCSQPSWLQQLSDKRRKQSCAARSLTQTTPSFPEPISGPPVPDFNLLPRSQIGMVSFPSRSNRA